MYQSINPPINQIFTKHSPSRRINDTSTVILCFQWQFEKLFHNHNLSFQKGASSPVGGAMISAVPPESDTPPTA